MQGIEIGAGIENHFSVDQVIETAISGGVNTFFGVGLNSSLSSFSNNMTPSSFANAALQSAKSATVSQLIEMGLGRKSKFEVSEIIQAIAQNLVSSKLGSYGNDPVSQTVLSTIGSTAVDDIRNRNFNVEQLAASMVGKVAVTEFDIELQKEMHRGWQHDSESTPSKPESRPMPAPRPMTAEEQRFIAETEAVTQFHVSDPSLEMGDGSVSSNIANGLSEMNRARLQRWQTEQTARAGSVAAGAGRRSSFFFADHYTDAKLAKLPSRIGVFNENEKPIVATASSSAVISRVLESTNVPAWYAKVHDNTDTMMSEITEGDYSPIFKRTPLGFAVSAVQGMRRDAMTLTYGDRQARIDVAKEMAIQAGIGITIDIGVGLIGKAAPIVWGGVEAIGNASMRYLLWGAEKVVPDVGWGVGKGVGNYGGEKAAINIGDELGRLGTVVKNPGLKITSLDEQGHFISSQINREVKASDIINTLKEPVAVLQQSQGRYLYLSDTAAVVINDNGKAITTWGSKNFDMKIKNILQNINRTNTYKSPFPN